MGRVGFFVSAFSDAVRFWVPHAPSLRLGFLNFPSYLLLRLRRTTLLTTFLQHRPIRIRIRIARCVRRGDIINISYDHRPPRSSILDIQSFVQLVPILRQFKCTAHLPAQRTLLIRNQLASIPLRQNFLLVAVRRLLQFPSVSVQQQFVRLIVSHIHFRILQFDIERLRGINQLRQLGIVLQVLPRISRATRRRSTSAPGPTSPPASASRITARISARISAATITAARIASVVATRVLRSPQFLPRIVTLVSVHLPRPGQCLPPRQFRRLRFSLSRRPRGLVRRALLRRRRMQNRPRRRLRIHSRRTTKPRHNKKSQNRSR